MELLQLDADKFRDLGTLFLHIHEGNPRAQVNMMTCHVSECGTAACHAGWFYWVTEKDLNGIQPDMVKRFQYGKERIADFLGFEDSEELTDWAGYHQELLGSRHGANMFHDRLYRNTPFGENPTLETIAHFWLETAERIEKAQKRARKAGK